MNEQRTLRTMKAKEKMRKVGYAVGTAVATAAPFVAYSFAAAAGGGGTPATTILSKFLGYVVDMFICVGILLGVWSIAQLALSFKNEDADSKSRAMMMLVVSIILMAIKPLAQMIITASGAHITIGTGFLTMMPMLTI